ncbi:unnamed protein product [Vitrella brassicaformis CCMP3155]|uniref:Uncharacterized protein n=1 Tax=Vitrella brassicaformis (strain CCMP3155) TaxID=1169540 RepID=A0A0G4F8X0_VITBC|nr:unnamed protein product [Vitrella brassicaformis CCMP3155]|eukprot:CEM09024.1 unnamed protein product [Vitrella brassicaformis CCMP3155]
MPYYAHPKMASRVDPRQGLLSAATAAALWGQQHPHHQYHQQRQHEQLGGMKMQEPHHQQHQQHPFSYIFVGRRTFYLLSLTDILRLRATCTWLRCLFRAPQLRVRLRHSVGSQAGLRRLVNGQQVQLVRFDDDHFGVCDLLAAVCVMEEGDWMEMGEVIELAGQCGHCDLPVILTADDIRTHASKTAYRSVARVLAQLMVVGRHVAFGDGSCLQIFRHGNGEVRAIRDEPFFRLQVNPPLPAHHLYQQHRQPHDPPVNGGFIYSDGWGPTGLPYTDASVSSFAKDMVLNHFSETHQTNRTSSDLDRRVGGGRLDGLLTQSPHTPVAGCTTTLSYDVGVRVETTEAPVCASGPFKDRFPLTTQLARVALGAVAPYVFDGQVQQQQQQQDDDNDSEDGADEGDTNDGSGEGDGGEGGVAEAESGN